MNIVLLIGVIFSIIIIYIGKKIVYKLAEDAELKLIENGNKKNFQKEKNKENKLLLEEFDWNHYAFKVIHDEISELKLISKNLTHENAELRNLILTISENINTDKYSDYSRKNHRSISTLGSSNKKKNTLRYTTQEAATLSSLSKHYVPVKI